MSGCRIVPKGEATTSTARPLADSTGSSSTSEAETTLVTESTDYDRFLKTTTMEALHSKRNTEKIVESDVQAVANDIEDFYSAMNLTDFNDTEVFNASTASGGGKPFHGGGFQFKHDAMPFENELENSTEYRVDVEEMFQKLESQRPIREIDSPKRPARPEQLTPFTRRSTRDTLLVRCHNAGTFFSARERWWYIAVANCGSEKGLDITYRFKMTNGNPGDFWSEHYSADEMRKCP